MSQAKVFVSGGGEHDWALLLEQWGWLERDQGLGGAVYLMGVALYATAVIGGESLLGQPDEQSGRYRIDHHPTPSE